VGGEHMRPRCDRQAHQSLSGFEAAYSGYWSDPFASRDHHVIGRFPEEVSLDLVILLVNNGSDLTARDKDGFIPLLTAAKTLKLKILDYLLERDQNSRMEIK